MARGRCLPEQHGAGCFCIGDVEDEKVVDTLAGA